QLLCARFRYRMAPIRRHVEKRLEHEGAVLKLRMGQDERSDPLARDAFQHLRPADYEPLIVDDIEVQGARAPWPTASAARLPLDLLQEPQQGWRRQARGDQRHLIDVRRLPRGTERRGFIERGDGLDRDAPPFDLGKRPAERMGGASPRPGTICTQAYQDFPMPVRLRRHLSVPMLLVQPRTRKFPQGCSFLASILLTLGF